MKTLSILFASVLLISFVLISCDRERPIDIQDPWPGEKQMGHVLSLNGTWEIEQGENARPPSGFSRTIPVPGIIKNALPPFDDAGKLSDLREAYWYRKTFVVPEYEYDVARLIIGKSRFGTTVLINGKEIGHHMLNHTAGRFDVTQYLKNEGENELIIRVGAHISDAPDTVSTAGEIEKERYFSGIYDDIELVFSKSAYISNVQAVPDIQNNQVGILTEWTNSGTADEKFSYKVRVYSASGTLISSQEVSAQLAPSEIKSVESVLPIPTPNLWTPDNPNLYLLEVEKEDETYQTRFGMRTFRIDAAFTNKALLNEEQIFLRGTNVSLFRFFEDSLCNQQPWDRNWVVKLHERFKEMNWNSYRVSICALPDFWYDIADEMGFVIFDEYPMWYALQNEMASPEQQQVNLAHPVRRYGVYPMGLTAERLSREYLAWMREHWNHASVCAWDAQNETWSPETGKAVQMVRHFDRSDRPWDNGWSPPLQEGDYREAHNYYAAYNVGSEEGNPRAILPEPFKLSDLPKKDQIGFTFYFPYQSKYENGEHDAYWDFPCVLNEYGYLWLNRDGTPTTLTRPYYDAVLGKNATPDERFYHYARMLAGITEFWRSSRTMFGVLHVFGLSFSADYAATGDMFVDIDGLTYYPYFDEYVKDAFNPLGISIDHWEEKVKAHTEGWPPVSGIEIPVIITNDFNAHKKGVVELILKDLNTDSIYQQKRVAFEVTSLQQKRIISKLVRPKSAGKFQLSATIVLDGEKGATSYRDLEFTE